MRNGKKSRSGEIRVGSRVTFQMASGPMRAVVVEDRGNIGWNGRRLMSVRPLFEGVEDMDTWELPLEELTLAE